MEQFRALEEMFSNGDKTYSGSVSYSNTNAYEIFELCFGDGSKGFLERLLAGIGYSISGEMYVGKWEAKTSIPTAVRDKVSSFQRNLMFKTTTNGFSFFSKKDVSIQTTQTAFMFGNSTSECKRFVLLAMIRSESSGTASEYSVMEKWDVTFHEDRKKSVEITFDTSLLLHGDQTRSTTIARSKSLRFSQAQFEQWRKLAGEALYEKHKALKPLQTPDVVTQIFSGKWNKLKSSFRITIDGETIQYHDGATFKVHCEKRGDQYVLRALYADGPFEGVLSSDKRIITWSNGSIWIRDGFAYFSGVYQDARNRKCELTRDGMVKKRMPDGTTFSAKFVLISADEIMYEQEKQRFKGRFADSKHTTLQWSDNTVWKVNPLAKPRKLLSRRVTLKKPKKSASGSPGDASSKLLSAATKLTQIPESPSIDPAIAIDRELVNEQEEDEEEEQEQPEKSPSPNEISMSLSMEELSAQKAEDVVMLDENEDGNEDIDMDIDMDIETIEKPEEKEAEAAHPHAHAHVHVREEPEERSRYGRSDATATRDESLSIPIVGRIATADGNSIEIETLEYFEAPLPIQETPRGESDLDIDYNDTEMVEYSTSVSEWTVVH